MPGEMAHLHPMAQHWEPLNVVARGFEEGSMMLVS